MSNLIKAAEELEYVPKEDLIRMAESGDSRFPPYLVLSEIQRRTQNEKAYNAMQPPPTTTVAEEKVAEFAQSGLGGMASPLFSPPPEDLPMSPPMQMAASGGLTGYANRGRTTYQGTFSKINDEAFSNIFAPATGLAGQRTRDIMSSLQANPSYANVSNILFTTPLAGFGRREGFDENELRKDLTMSLLEGEEAFKTKLSEVKGEGRISNIQEKEILDAYTAPPIIASKEIKGDQNNDNSFLIQEGDGTPPPNVTTTPTTDVFGTLDELRKRMKDVEYKSPTADDLRDDRISSTLMYLGSLIAGSTDRKEFGKGLADLTSKVVADKRADDRFLNEARLKERGLLSADLQLATALETLKVRAVQANNTAAKNKIDEALGMIQAANLADQDTRKRLLEKATQIFLGLSGESTASQADVDAIVGGAKS